jgi:hypothetical protein
MAFGIGGTEFGIQFDRNSNPTKTVERKIQSFSALCKAELILWHLRRG